MAAVREMAWVGLYTGVGNAGPGEVTWLPRRGHA